MQADNRKANIKVTAIELFNVFSCFSPFYYRKLHFLFSLESAAFGLLSASLKLLLMGYIVRSISCPVTSITGLRNSISQLIWPLRELYAVSIHINIAVTFPARRVV